MADQDTEINNHKHRKLRKILLVLLLLLIPSSLILLFMQRNMGGILLFILLLDVIVMVWLTKEYYNWTLVFLLLIVIAIIFKGQRWPITGILYTFGFTGLACTSFYSSAVFLKRYNQNTFLKYIGFSSSIILSIVSLGLLWKSMYWPGANIILNVGLIVFIPFLFAFIFTLPGSNYINWSKFERIVFFRAIIIPMSFVYILCVLMFVFPDLYRLMTRLPLTPFNMFEFDLLNMPGL